MNPVFPVDRHEQLRQDIISTLAASTDAADFASTFEIFGHSAILVTNTKEGVISTNIDWATLLAMGPKYLPNSKKLSAKQIAASSPPSQKTKLSRLVSMRGSE